MRRMGRRSHRDRTAEIRTPMRRRRTMSSADPDPGVVVPVPIAVTGYPHAAIPYIVVILRSGNYHYRCGSRSNYHGCRSGSNYHGCRCGSGSNYHGCRCGSWCNYHGCRCRSHYNFRSRSKNIFHQPDDLGCQMQPSVIVMSCFKRKCRCK